MLTLYHISIAKQIKFMRNRLPTEILTCECGSWLPPTVKPGAAGTPATPPGGPGTPIEGPEAGYPTPGAGIGYHTHVHTHTSKTADEL